MGGYSRMMEIGYDPAKRDKPLKEHGLDFEDTRLVLQDQHLPLRAPAKTTMSGVESRSGFCPDEWWWGGAPPGTRFGEFSQ